MTGSITIFGGATEAAAGGGPVTFSFVRSAANQADPASATFGGTPTQGNLLIAIAMERSGTTEANHTISGTGWTKRIGRDVLLGDADARRSLSVWTKIAGASEATNVQVDDGTANTKALLIAEYAPDVAATFTFEAAASNDNGTTSTSNTIATGTTASVGAGNLLVLGIVALKVGGISQNDMTAASWASDTLTNDALFGGGANGRSLAVGSATQTGAGTKASTATLTINTVVDDYLTAGIVVFSAEAT